MSVTLHFTPALYRVLSAIDQSGLSITRNGALEPFMHFVAKEGATNLIRKGNLDLGHIERLHKAKLIEFSNNGMYGVFQGAASLTDAGKAVLNGPWRVESQKHELKGRVAELSVPDQTILRMLKGAHFAPGSSLELPSGEALDADEANALVVDPAIAAIERVQRFVDEWPKRSNVHPDDIYLMQTMDRENDEVVELPLRRSDLLTLLKAIGR